MAQFPNRQSRKPLSSDDLKVAEETVVGNRDAIGEEVPNNVIDIVVREYVETNKNVKENNEVSFKLIELDIESELENPKLDQVQHGDT